jgi:dipeptidyl aminopeptidase/acylaminoacyl peptidase
VAPRSGGPATDALFSSAGRRRKRARSSTLNLSDGTRRVIRRSSAAPECVQPHISIPEPISFRTEGGETAHAIYYPPFSPAFAAPAGEKAPVLVLSHGGPTSSASSTLSLEVQYWTSHGVGVLDVNYCGSTGYRRAYRLKLERRWASWTSRIASMAPNTWWKTATPTPTG